MATIDEEIRFLERVPLLGLLGQAALRVVAIGAETRYVGPGAVLFVAGEKADAAYLIEEGSFSLLPDDASGPEAETVARRGSLLGEMALMKETLRPATATALEPSTVIRIPRTLFLKMLEGYPDAARRLRDHLLARSEQLVRDVAQVRERLKQQDGEGG